MSYDFNGGYTIGKFANETIYLEEADSGQVLHLLTCIILSS